MECPHRPFLVSDVPVGDQQETYRSTVHIISNRDYNSIKRREEKRKVEGQD